MDWCGHRTLLLVAAFAVLTCGAWTKHYSFSNGYPANSGISSSAAKSLESGGASISTTSKARQTKVVAAEKSIVGKVTKVVDGDTVTVTPNGGRGRKIRLYRIDAPESDQPGGDKATAFLKELVGGKNVEVKYSKHDDNGRILGTVYMKTDDGKLVDVNLTMILNGWSWHYYSFKENDKFPPYDKAEQAARKAKAGLWAEESPIRPYDWRHGKR